MTAQEEFDVWFITRQEYGYDLALNAWKEARNRGIEEAAKECEEMAKQYDSHFELDRSAAATNLAAYIRSLKD